MRVPGDGVRVGVRGEAEVDGKRGGGCDVFESGALLDHSGSESATADGRAGLQAQVGGGPRRSVNHSSDAKSGDVLCFEKAVDEGVQESVGVGVEDANSKESGCVEHAVDHIGGGERGPDDVRTVPVLPGVGGFAAARVIRLPIGIVAAGTGVWR